MKKKSQFGKGFVYPLGLFMMHVEQIAAAKTVVEFLIAATGALDHLKELNIPLDLPKNIVRDISHLSNRLHRYCRTIPFFIPKDRDRIVYQAKSILFNIDKDYLKVNPRRGE